MSKAKTNMIIKRIVDAAMTVLQMLSFWAFIGTQTALICSLFKFFHFIFPQ